MSRVVAKSLLSLYHEELEKAYSRVQAAPLKSQITRLLRIRKEVQVTFIYDGSFTTCIIHLEKGKALVGTAKCNSSTDKHKMGIGETLSFHRAVKRPPVTLTLNNNSI